MHPQKAPPSTVIGAGGGDYFGCLLGFGFGGHGEILTKLQLKSKYICRLTVSLCPDLYYIRFNNQELP